MVISAANGNRSKDAAGKVCVQKAYEMIVGGSDVLVFTRGVGENQLEIRGGAAAGLGFSCRA